MDENRLREITETWWSGKMPSNLEKRFPCLLKNFPNTRLARSLTKFAGPLSRCHPTLPKDKLANLPPIALGSFAEVNTQLTLAQEFGYLTKEDVDVMDIQIQNLCKKLYALMTSLAPR